MSTKNFFFLGLFAAAVMGFAACAADKDCGVNGVADTDGKTCICDQGYEYDADGVCNVLSEHKFVGGYITTETCSLSGLATPYGVAIAHGTSETDLTVTIKGAYGKDGNGDDFYQKVVNGTVTGNTITIAKQDPDGDGFFIEGSGTIDPASTPVKITLSYTITYPDARVDACTGTVLTKQ